MLKHLYNTISGPISVVGSAPSASRFHGSDYSIAVNGAALLPHKFNIFMCGDKSSSSRSWFYAAKSSKRVIADIIAAQDIYLYPDANAVKDVHHSKLPKPSVPHEIYSYKPYRPNIVKTKPDYLMYGGTISCCAAQLSYYLGASTIKLFGCEFSKERANHYFYKDAHTGNIFDSMRLTMDKVLQEIRDHGVRIEIIGRTYLTSFDKQYEN